MAIKVNGTVGSNDNITLNSLVSLSSSTSATTYLWAIVAQPSGTPNAVLDSTTNSIVEFTANKEGSYLIRLITDEGLATEAIDQVIVAVRELQTGNRIPAAGETIENNAETGWANTAVDQILQRVTRFADQGVLVGTAGVAGMLPLSVVYISDVVTIATGLPGERLVPEFSNADANDATTVHGQLGVVLGGVDGSPTPAQGDLIRVAVLTAIQSVPLGTPGQPAGTPVYVSDTGTISLTPGTVTRQIGTVIDDMGGGDYGVWITGEGSFGTLQGLSATAPVSVTGGVSPTVSLDYDLGNLTATGGNLNLTTTGVGAGTYGSAAPAYPATPASLVPELTVDTFGRITAATQAGLTIGGSPAKTYVDGGDATTLAAAEAYAQTLAYGLSSKVPVHVATTQALPPCTVNGTFQTLTANVHGPLLPAYTDGHTLLVGERILVKNQVAQANNGIYVLTQAGGTSPSQPWILTRADDANSAAELCGSLVTVNVGNTLAGTTWIFAFNPTAFQIGLTAVVFTQLNATPATVDAYGTVKLDGAFAGVGSTAALPVVALGSGYVSGVLPVANGGTNGTAIPAAGGVAYGTGTAYAFTPAGAAKRPLLSNGASAPAFGQLDLADTTVVSNTLGATNGGTGLTTSGAADAFLVGDGSGGWTTRTNFVANSCLTGTIAQPLTLQGRSEGSIDVLRVTREPGTVATAFWLFTPSGQSLNIQPRIETGETQGATPGNTSIKAESAIGAGKAGGTMRVEGGNTNAATGGQVFVTAGDCYGTFKAPAAYLRGGASMTAGQTSGDAYVQGGGGYVDNGNGGDVFVYGGDADDGIGGDVTVRGGESSVGNGGNVSISGGANSGTNGLGGNVTVRGGTSSGEEIGGTVTVEGGVGYIGGDVIIQPGDGSPSEDGVVYIRRRVGSTTGQVVISDAFVNGNGTTGQLFTSNGAGSPPSWQGDAGGPAARGASRVASGSATLTTSDFMFYGTSPGTITLPVASTIPAGRMFIVKSGANNGLIQLAVQPGDQIDGSNGPWPLNQYEARRVIRVSGISSEWLFI